MPVDPSYNRNSGTKTDTYAEAVYAFLASGGFTIERGFADVKKYESMAPEHVDVTDSVQIMLDVSTFNAKLGAFNSVSDSFANSSITISSADLITGLTKGGQVFSAGKYSTLYSDFTNYVSSYFGNVGGFSSLFEGASEFGIDGSNNFTGASFVRLLNGETVDASGQYISNLSGAVTISDITTLLRYVVDANVFGNRDPATKNWGMADGFVEGDLIWVPAGTTVTLKVGIDREKYNPTNNIGPTLTQNTDYTANNFSSSTVATTTLITRTVTAPLLIKLVSSATIASLPADVVYPSNGSSGSGTGSGSGTTGGSTGSGTTGGTTGGSTGSGTTGGTSGSSGGSTGGTSGSSTPPPPPPEPVVPVSMSNFILLGSTASGTSYVTSPDATWTLDGNTSNLKSAASSGSNYYAVGTPAGLGTSTVVKSLDGGVTWRLALKSPFATSGNDVLFIGNTVVACGSGGNTLAYVVGATDTPAGNTWATVDTGLTSGTQLFYDAAATRLYVVGSGANTISFASSPSGTWSGLGKYVFPDEATTIHGPATYAAPKTWVAVGQGGTSLAYGTSADGVVTNVTSPLTSAAAVAHGADANGTPIWVAGGQGTNTLAFSRNPSAGWTGMGATVLSTNCKGVAYGVDASGEHVWVAVGSGATNTLAFSKNPVAAARWSGLGKTLFTAGYGVACGKDASGNALWMAAGAGTAHTLAFSRNPTVAGSWTGLGKTMFSTVCFSVAYGTDCSGNPIWVAAGQDDAGANALAYSRDPTDATKWVGLGSNALSVGQSVAFGTDGSGAPIWLAAGSGVSTVAYSRNPTVAASWTGISTGLASSAGYSVSYGTDASGQALWMVGQMTTNTVIYSNFPTVAGSWAKPSANMFSIAGAAFAQERMSKYVAGGVGKNGLAGSFDGQTWYPIKSPFTVATHDVYWSQEQQLWVAVGEGTHTLAHSTNGIEWEGHGLSVFSVRGKKVTYSAADGKWYATGEGTYTAASSTDGHEWIPTGTTTPIPVPITTNNLVLLGTTSAGSSSTAPLGASVATEDNTTSTISVVAYDGVSTYYAGGTGAANLVQSTDGGSTWFPVASPFTTSVTDIVFAGQNTVVAAGTGTNTLAYNSGSGWAPISTGQTSVSQLFYDPSASRTYSAGVGANTLAYAGNVAGAWTGLGNSYVLPNGVNTMHGPCNPVGGRLWIAGGISTGNSFAVTNTIDSSSSWVGFGKNILNAGVYAMNSGVDASGNLIYLATGGASATSNLFAYSSTPSIASSWTGIPSKIFGTGYAIQYGTDASGNSLWVAGGTGTGNTLAYSYDPLNANSWVGLGKQFNSYPGSFAFGKDSSNKPLWVAVGSGSGNTICYSKNPTVSSSWVGLGVTYFATFAQTVAYGTDGSGTPIWVAGGTDNTHTLAYSYNPTSIANWVGAGKITFASAVNSVAYGMDISGKPLWVAVGSGANTIAYSTTGKTWVGLSNTILSTPASVSYGIDSSGFPIWIVSGSGAGNTIAYSNNPTVKSSWIGNKNPSFSTTYAYIQERIPKYIAGGTGIDNMSGSIDGQTWFYIKSPFTTATNEVFWSPQQNLWVAVGEGTNTVAYSSNGITWTGLGTTVFGLYGKNISYSASENKWYATGYSLIGGLATATSTDGITWTTTASTLGDASEPVVASNFTLLGNTASGTSLLLDPTATFTFDKYTSTINAVATDGTTLYAGASGATTVATSTDGGSTWTPIASPFSTATNDITIVGSQVVAAGSGGNAVALYNGTSWTSVNTGLTVGTHVYYDASGSRVYAMGTGANTFAFSSVPATASGWKGLGKYVFANGVNTMSGPANYASGRLWVAGGGSNSSNSIAYSGNGISWTGIGLTTYSSSMRNIAYGADNNMNTLWVSVGQGTGNSIAYSNNGISWTGLNKTIFSSSGYNVSYGCDISGVNLWVAVGGLANTIAYSTNGVNWVGLGKTIFSSNGTCVAFGYDNIGKPLWIAGGDGTTNNFAYSYNPTVLSNWVGLGKTTFSQFTHSIAYGADGSGNSLWVAGGQGTNTLAYSRNGTTWFGLGNTIIPSYTYGIAHGKDGFGNNLWVAGGGYGVNGNTLAYSNDGVKWVGLGNTILTDYVQSVFYGDSLWVATGSGNASTKHIAISVDGYNWSSLNSSPFYGIGYSAIQEKTPKFIAGGTGVDNMRGSIDGQTWYYIKSPFRTATNDVCWSQQQQLWVAVGEGGNTLAYSSNGIKWTGLNLFSIRGKKVTYNATENRWYATGEGGSNTMFVSLDAKYWVKYPTTSYSNMILLGTSSTAKSFAQSTDPFTYTWVGQNLFTVGRSIAYDGTATYYAVGDGTSTMQTSTDNGTTWSSAVSPFTTSGRDVLYAGSQLVACGSGTNTLAYYNGTTWTPVNTGLTTGLRLYYEPSIPRIYALGQGTNTMSFASSASGSWTGLGKYVFPNGTNTMHGPANYTSAKLWVGTANQNSIAYTSNPFDGSQISRYSYTLASTSPGYSAGNGQSSFGTDQNGNSVFVYVHNGGWSNPTTNQLITFTTNRGLVLHGNSFTGTTNFSKCVKYGPDASGNPVWVIGFDYLVGFIRTPMVAGSVTKLGTSIGGRLNFLEYGNDISGNTVWISGTDNNTFTYSINPTVSWQQTSSISGFAIFSSGKFGLDINYSPICVITGGNNIAYSNNPSIGASSWTSYKLTNISSSISSICYGLDNTNKPLWIVGASSSTETKNTILYSYDPTNASSWVGLGLLKTGTVQTGINDLGYELTNSGTPIWYATSSAISEYTIYYSYNPTSMSNWVTVMSSPWTVNPLTKIVTETKPKYIAGGTGAANMKGSIDGQTWYYIPSPFTTATNDVYWSQSQQIWVAVGEGTNTVAYSTNGMAWTGLGTSIFSTRGNKITFSTTQNMWFIAGEGTNTLAASYDGKSWMPITSTAGYVDISGIGLYVK